MSKTLRHSFLAAALTILPAISWGAAPDCEVAKQALKIAADIRGLRPKKDIPCLVHQQDQVRNYILHALSTKISPEKFQHEELLFKALGLLPEDFAYKDGLIKLYLSQIGGYYDPEKEHFVMASWIPGMIQSSVAVHELNHALQDQYFDLEKFTEDEGFTSDVSLARAALVEGDATAVMIDYARGLTGQAGIAREPSVRSLLLQNVIGMSLVSMPGEVPESLKLALLFPYTSGLRFVHHLLRDGGYKRVDEAFGRPPRSTEEVLHLEKYSQSNADFINISADLLEADVVSDEAKRIYHDTLGEFMIATLVAGLIKDKARGSEAAAGWGGDTAVLYEKTSDKSLAVWRSHWDSEQDARQFEAAMHAGFFGERGLEESGKWTFIAGRREWKEGRIQRDGLDVTVSVRR
jgi:hypothetical protein